MNQLKCKVIEDTGLGVTHRLVTIDLSGLRESLNQGLKDLNDVDPETSMQQVKEFHLQILLKSEYPDAEWPAWPTSPIYPACGNEDGYEVFYSLKHVIDKIQEIYFEYRDGFKEPGNLAPWYLPTYFYVWVKYSDELHPELEAALVNDNVESMHRFVFSWTS